MAMKFSLEQVGHHKAFACNRETAVAEFVYENREERQVYGFTMQKHVWEKMGRPTEIAVEFDIIKEIS